uniref:Uncharacterized protein n=1 Tax=Anguilla anguilla TaxID=7936 RepID=A0A0E9QS87_ANGAN
MKYLNCHVPYFTMIKNTNSNLNLKNILFRRGKKQINKKKNAKSLPIK